VLFKRRNKTCNSFCAFWQHRLLFAFFTSTFPYLSV
jgi:hypothetical protein